jgi:hypothetical protein
MPSKIKELMTIRINKSLKVMLDSEPYKRHKGKLIRLLLEAYFQNLLPGIKYKFEAEIKNGK